jgi:hypothetical protein
LFLLSIFVADRPQNRFADEKCQHRRTYVVRETALLKLFCLSATHGFCRAPPIRPNNNINTSSASFVSVAIIRAKFAEKVNDFLEVFSFWEKLIVTELQSRLEIHYHNVRCDLHGRPCDFAVPSRHFDV